MIGSSDEIVPVPHPFSHNEKRTILAFANDLKLQVIENEILKKMFPSVGSCCRGWCRNCCRPGHDQEGEKPGDFASHSRDIRRSSKANSALMTTTSASPTKTWLHTFCRFVAFSRRASPQDSMVRYRNPAMIAYRYLGGLGIDLPKMIEMFKNGVKLEIKADPVFPIWGLSDSVIGRVSTEKQQNARTLIKCS